jgi:hypothetical protein
MGTSKFIDSSAAFPFEVPEQNLPLVVQELQIGGTSGPILTFASHLGATFANVRIKGPLAKSLILVELWI